MSTDEQAIRELVEVWHRATAIGKIDLVLGLMSEDVVFLVCGKPPMWGRKEFERGLRALLAEHRIESSGVIQEIEVSGNLAYCWTNLTVRIIPLLGGAETVRAGSALSILHKQASGAWVIVRDANLMAPT